MRVLVVDDQADARELLSVALADRGAAVHLAASAKEAMEVFLTHEINVLVTDISMPETDGFGLIESVRALTLRSGHRIRRIAVTAYMGREVRERALAAGSDAFATKPLEADDLTNVIDRLR